MTEPYSDLGGLVKGEPLPKPEPSAEWCGSCEAPSFRFIEHDGKVLRCPRCHPRGNS